MGNGSLGELSESKYKELFDKKALGLFRVGEKVEIHGSPFEIVNIGTEYLTLRILKH